MAELLRTKLYIPRQRANLVPRPRLLERLDEGFRRKLTLIAAPAGFGKTTLLSEWIRSNPHAVTWLSLDSADNDPIRFWTYWIASLQCQSPELGAAALAQLQASQPPPLLSILTSLLNDISALPDTFASVLDDYHAIDAPEIHNAVAFVLDNLPDNLRLIITTRADPPLPLARLRARDQMVELRAAELSFTTDEAALFLNQVMGLDLSPAQVSALETRTEGWVAGLQIAGLSLRGRADVPAFIQNFSGSHRHILSYLVEEVLSHQPPDTVAFLLQTSILERMCGALCDAVTLSEGGQAKLEQLERAHLFLVALDEQGNWYRYHHLFAQVLQQRCRQVYPDAQADLHRRASQWFQAHELIDQALHHALAGGDLENAARLVDRHAWGVLTRGETFVLRSWLEQFPPEAILTHPRLVLVQARLLAITGNLEAGDRLLARFAEQTDESALPTGVQGELEQVRVSMARIRGDLPDALRHGKRALELLPPDEYETRAVILTNMALAYLELGEPAQARAALDQILAFSQEKAAVPVWRARAFVGWLDSMRGETASAVQAVESVISQAEHASAPPPMVLGMAYLVLGELAYDRNALAEAQRACEQAISLMEATIGQFFLGQSYGKLLRILQATGDPAAAQALARAETWLTRTKMRDFGFATILASERALLWLRQGDLERAARWAAELRDEQALDAKFAEAVRDFVVVRVYLAQGKYAQALARLETLENFSKPKQWTRFLCEIECLRALAWSRQGHSQAAFASLENALAFGAAGGFLRIFLDEGEPLRKLLVEHRKHRHPTNRDHPPQRADDFLDRVLAAFSDAEPIPPAPLLSSAPHASQGGVEPLSPRELEVLRLIADGLSNREIAEKLVISTGTAKRHVNNIYAKLDVGSRVQAVERARSLGLF